MASDQTPDLLAPTTAFGQFLASRKGRWSTIAVLFASATAVTVVAQTLVVGSLQTSPCDANPCMVMIQNRAQFAHPIAWLISFVAYAAALLLARRLDMAGDLAWDAMWVCKLSMRVNPNVSFSKVQEVIDFVTRWVTNLLITLSALCLFDIFVLLFSS